MLFADKIRQLREERKKELAEKALEVTANNKNH